MDMLQDLLGGGQRQEYDDFVQRYDQGAPWTGISDQEAAQRYEQIAPRLSPQQYEDSAAQAFERLTPEQRAEFGQWLASRSQGGGMSFGSPDDYRDPRRLAQYTSRVRQEQPDLLGQLVGGLTGGGGQSGFLGGPSGGGGQSGFLSNPIGKAALAGIAATAVRNMMSGR